MLVLSRTKNQLITIGNDVTVVVVDIRAGKVRLGIEAPKDVPVHRQEVFEAIVRETGNPPATTNGDLDIEIDELLSYAACSKLTNTPEYLNGLADRINSLLSLRQDDSRVERVGDSMRIVRLPF